MSISIHVKIPDDGEGAFVHRFRNFGEDVYRALRDSCLIDIDEIDASTTRFSVRNVKRDQVCRTCEEIRQIAEQHFFAETLDLKEIEA